MCGSHFEISRLRRVIVIATNRCGFEWESAAMTEEAECMRNPMYGRTESELKKQISKNQRSLYAPLASPFFFVFPMNSAEGGTKQLCCLSGDAIYHFIVVQSLFNSFSNDINSTLFWPKWINIQKTRFEWIKHILVFIMHSTWLDYIVIGNYNFTDVDIIHHTNQRRSLFLLWNSFHHQFWIDREQH